ncbi:helix-turn-helix domain-containing protein [Streptomyces sp. ME19-01-6]|uniref:helix-turn-helix domain-containing protein n=1 Tax=Streptomyces sp. ME19-01-6 TaxID=3028686 RepID=UPI0029B69E3C|nr:helix-turn-helix domain-containing protein [Streptomyces sp. ME19-01-6]MDX3224578.1 helix-turn-helix domain-containing protein [Streptomyces sp. ME19-01-6]
MGTDDFQDPAAARVELRAQLEAGRVALGLNQTELARRAGLGRTSVSQALSTAAPAPSAQTVGALARALRLDVRPLLDLLTTVSGSPHSSGGALGKPIADWDPHDLEVHPAAEAPARTGYGTGPGGEIGQGRRGLLPSYVGRGHDVELAALIDAATQGCSRMVVLVGSSSTGKTRACWEAVQPLAEYGWRLWHPFDPTRAEAALADIERVGPRTVVWLNEAQHYLGAGGGLGERIAAALHALLTDPARGPVLVLGTLWPEYATAYTAMPRPGGEDPHPRVRELLAGRQIPLPDSFDTAATAAAKALASAGDRQLAHALEHMGDGRLAQFLAGAPELVRHYETASPPARALLRAAMDARRLGVGLHLPVTFLEHAATDYLTDDEYDTLDDNWREQALAEATQAVHGNLAPLRRIRPRPTQHLTQQGSTAQVPPAYRLADYLEQHGREIRKLMCPPASFWKAAHHHLTQPDIFLLAYAAEARHRTYWAYHLWQKAADAGSTEALARLAGLREGVGDREGADRLAREAADAGNTDALARLADMRMSAGTRDTEGEKDGAERLLREEGAEGHLRRAADAGNTFVLVLLAELLNMAGDRSGAEQFAQQAAQTGNTDALLLLARMREEIGDREGAERLLRRADDVGNTEAVGLLAELWEKAGDCEGAERIAREAADAGNTDALARLADMRKIGGTDGVGLWTYGLDPDGRPSTPW